MTPRAQGEVLALDLARRQRRDERGVRLRRARDDQQAARVLVQAVHEPGTRHDGELRVERQQCILQGVAGVARARVHHEARPAC